MSNDTLMPCPFCGGTPRQPEKSGGGDERNGYNFTVAIKCQDCGASVIRKSRENNGGWCTDTGQAKSEAIAAWNRRAANTATAPSQPVEQAHGVIPVIKVWKGVFDEKDCIITTYRPQPTGMLVGTDRGVRAIHVPTGLKVDYDEDRSQHRNKAKAMELLRDMVERYIQ